MKLWIDDLRDAPDDSWTVVRKVEAAIKAIVMFRPDEISIDHDIENRPDDETFRSVAYLIGEKYLNDTFWADDLVVRVHSGNPVGAKQIQDILEGYGIFAEWTPYTTQADFAKKYGLNN